MANSTIKLEALAIKRKAELAFAATIASIVINLLLLLLLTFIIVVIFVLLSEDEKYFAIINIVNKMSNDKKNENWTKKNK